MRNKIFMLALLAGFVVSYAAAPTNDIVDGAYEWEVDTTISDADGFDSLEGDAGDSIVLAAAYYPEPGWEYILVTGATTEADEAEFILRVVCLDEDKDALYTESAVDTLNDDGGAILLDFGGTLIGTYFMLLLDDGAANSGVSKVNTVKMYRRRVVTRNKAQR